MSGKLEVQKRESRGKKEARRMRDAGKIPAVLYGHGEETLALAVPAGPLNSLVHHGTRMVSLTGAVEQSAYINEVQWDTWGMHVLHVDFTRVSADEKIEVAIALELRGEAPGVKSGGVVNQLLHEVTLDCPAAKIPDKIQVNINHLELDESITLGDLELPEGASIVGEPVEVVAQCVMPVEEVEVEEEVGEAGTEEPEVLGRKKEDEEGEG